MLKGDDPVKALENARAANAAKRGEAKQPVANNAAPSPTGGTVTMVNKQTGEKRAIPADKVSEVETKSGGVWRRE